MRVLSLTQGNATGGYGPDDTLNRAQMASFVVRLWSDILGGDRPTGDTPFTDVATTYTHAEAQDWFDRYFPHYGDVARLDGDGVGLACESLPS